MVDLSDDELLAELGISVEGKKVSGRTPREERIIAGFEDILKFREEHGSTPQHGEERDIFERLYAVRLDRLRALPDARELLAPLDKFGLLGETSAPAETDFEALDDEALLAELGITEEAPNDITVLRHVASREERRAAEDIANRTPCPDFAKFKPLFEKVQNDIETGARQTREFELKSEIRTGSWFIVGGQKAYVAEMGEMFSNAQGRTDARLRVVFENGTESNMLMRSLQRALHKDDAGRRITDPSAGPLFGNEAEGDDLESGTIYVLRSKSDHPDVATHRDLIHKIGVTGGSVEARINQAAKDATYLLADVEVVATYKLFNINRSRLEKIFHRLFGAVQLDLTIHDRFGQPVKPREWFLVPLQVIDEAVEKIKDGSIVEFAYDPATASLTPSNRR
jgi:hypothetical protein